jgi:hypothetical protein
MAGEDPTSDLPGRAALRPLEDDRAVERGDGKPSRRGVATVLARSVR